MFGSYVCIRVNGGGGDLASFIPELLAAIDQTDLPILLPAVRQSFSPEGRGQTQQAFGLVSYRNKVGPSGFMCLASLRIHFQRKP